MIYELLNIFNIRDLKLSVQNIYVLHLIEGKLVPKPETFFKELT